MIREVLFVPDFTVYNYPNPLRYPINHQVYKPIYVSLFSPYRKINKKQCDDPEIMLIDDGQIRNNNNNNNNQITNNNNNNNWPKNNLIINNNQTINNNWVRNRVTNNNNNDQAINNQITNNNNQTINNNIQATNNNCPIGNLNDKKVKITISMYKRVNGHFKWFKSNVSPQRIGKMRKIIVDFDRIPHPIKFIISTHLISTKGNNSTIMVAENHRIYKGQDNNMQNSLSCFMDCSTESKSKTYFLKPIWATFGPRNDKPRFRIDISVINLVTSKTVILHTWETEIHCHKRESSNKELSLTINDNTESLTSTFDL
jgi:hypothetical protein